MIDFVHGLVSGVVMTLGFGLYLGFKMSKDHPEVAQMLRDELDKQ